MNSDKYLDSYLSSFSRINDGRNMMQYLSTLPSMEDIRTLEASLMNLLYPGRSSNVSDKTLRDAVRFEMEFFSSLLRRCIYYALSSEGCAEADRKAEEAVDSTLSNLGEIRKMLKEDAEAGLDGDPAATSLSEVIICYPAFKALAVHRVAHHLYNLGIPLIPRMMNEYIHTLCGIDIHPGASIGRRFFIDHGTGVVIGQTCVIGNNVKLYQGVTLGALSFPRNACGELLKDAKRHPTIEDNVTIYANATILGDITIGENSTIGSSCWIKSDIPANTRVMNRDPEIILKPKSVKHQ